MPQVSPDPRPSLLTLAEGARRAGSPLNQVQVAWVAAVLEPQLGASGVQAFGPGQVFFELQGDDGLAVVVESSSSLDQAFVAPELRDAGLAVRSPAGGHYSLAAVIWWALTGTAPSKRLPPLGLEVDGELDVYLRQLLLAPDAATRGPWIDPFRSTLLALGDFEAPRTLRRLVDDETYHDVRPQELLDLVGDDLPIDSAPLPAFTPSASAFGDTLVLESMPPPLPLLSKPPALPDAAPPSRTVLAVLDVGDPGRELISMPPQPSLDDLGLVAVDDPSDGDRPTGASFSLAAPPRVAAPPRRAAWVVGLVALLVGAGVASRVSYAEPPRSAASFADAIPVVDAPPPPPPEPKPCRLRVEVKNPFFRVAIDGEDRGKAGQDLTVPPGDHEVHLVGFQGRNLAGSEKTVTCDDGEDHRIAY